MLSGAWSKSARANDDQQTDLLPRSEERLDGGGQDYEKDDRERGATSTPAEGPSASVRARDKIRSLDGLRGIACLLVFNYHFFWPWTSAIMMGYGALPPRAPEPYTEWPTLPILCLLHRGRPMVAIFFAISGYVLCRHILRAIHERRLESAYQSLASSVFRRIFRLYIPPTLSMFIVAILAQTGAFKAEDAIFKGPDSRWINGTVTYAHWSEPPATGCAPGLISASGPLGVAEALGLQNAYALVNLTANDKLCINRTSHIASPSALYGIADEFDMTWPNTTTNLTELTPEERWTKEHEYVPPEYLIPWVNVHRVPPHVNTLPEQANLTDPDSFNITWIQLGGSWEEHPFIHDNMTYALQNFTRAYAEWANPFNFGHYHPRYDPHTFTIPMELRGSMLLYIFLLGTAALKARWRLGFAGFLSAYSLWLGRWDMATFLGGATMSELDIRASSDLPHAKRPATSASARLSESPGLQRLARWGTIFLALYFLSYPDAGAEWTPGFIYLSSWVPRYYIPLSGWMFYQAMGALMLLPCVLRSPSLVKLLESRPAQYLGRVSFSLYLVHGPVLHCLGFWLMPRLFDAFGKKGGYAVGWVLLLTIVMYLTNLWHRKVDGWSVSVGKKLEKMLTVQ